VTTSSAEPARLESYEPALAPVDDGFAAVTWRLAADLGAFFVGAGEFAPAGPADDWIAPFVSLRAESSYLAGWVTSVGAAFRVAGGDPDGDGVYDGVSDTALSAQVGRPVRVEQLAYLAEQLGTLRERATAGELHLSPDELARLLAMASDLVASAPDPQAEAELLVAAMGPGDVVEALWLLESDATEATDLDHPAVTGMLDLGYIVSLALERQPARADRWADEIVDGRTAGPGARAFGTVGEGAAVMGAGNAPGTAVFTAALFADLVERNVSTPEGGLVDRLYGATVPGAPVLATAATRTRPSNRPWPTRSWPTCWLPTRALPCTGSSASPTASMCSASQTRSRGSTRS
jgi:hypothetical protein